MVTDRRGEPVTDPAAVDRTTDLAARYGRRTKGRRPMVIAAVAILAAGGLAWLLWVALAHSSPQVTSRLLGFEVVSPTAVTASIEVERTEDVAASCRVQAKSADFAIVGETTVTVPADAPRRQVLEASITTQRPATAAVLVGCTTAESHRPR
jgi:hypothetical protein